MNMSRHIGRLSKTFRLDPLTASQIQFNLEGLMMMGWRGGIDVRYDSSNAITLVKTGV